MVNNLYEKALYSTENISLAPLGDVCGFPNGGRRCHVKAVFGGQTRLRPSHRAGR